MRPRLWLAAAAFGGTPLLTVATFLGGTQHVPWEVPSSERAPAALHHRPNGPYLSLRYLGVSGYVLDDGRTTVLLDPTPTRPSPQEMLTGPVGPDESYGATVCPEADFIFVNHAHYDHAMDVPSIARRTGATVLGSKSTINLSRARGVPERQLQEVKPGDRLELGTFTAVVHGTRHADILGVSNPMSGLIPSDAKELWFWEYRADQTMSLRLEAAGRSIWFHPTSTFAAGEVGGPPADTLIMGVTGEPLTEAVVEGVVAEAHPRRVLPTHYDNFFQPRQKGIAQMPMLDLPLARSLFEAELPGVGWMVLDYDETIYLPGDGE